MDRMEYSREKRQALFGGRASDCGHNDPTLEEIMNRFIYGEIYARPLLTDLQRQLIALVALTVAQTLEPLERQTAGALAAGAAPAQIKEAVYQCAPYIGFPKVMAALERVNAAFAAAGVEQPDMTPADSHEAERLEKGLEVQKGIFGDTIDQMRAAAPDGQKHIQDYLSAMCFGDFYTRPGLDLPTRELLTLCMVSALGGCESQVKGHIQGNRNVGNSKQLMVEAITCCLPYMGFPRTLNALACINACIPE